MLFFSLSALPLEHRPPRAGAFVCSGSRHPGRSVGAESCRLVPSHPWCLVLPQAFVLFGPHFSKVLVAGGRGTRVVFLGMASGRGRTGREGAPFPAVAVRSWRAPWLVREPGRGGNEAGLPVWGSDAARSLVSPSPRFLPWFSWLLFYWLHI